jgi:hypothetical protein
MAILKQEKFKGEQGFGGLLVFILFSNNLPFLVTIKTSYILLVYII